MKQALQYSREPRGRSARSKLLFCVVGIGASVLATWFLWGREAWDRQAAFRDIQKIREYVFPPGIVVYSEDPVLRAQLKNKPGYRPANIEPAIVYDAKLAYSNGGPAIVYAGGRKSPAGIERVVWIRVACVLGDGLQPPAPQRELQIVGHILETWDYGGRRVGLHTVAPLTPLYIDAAQGSSFTVWAGQADPNDPSSVTFECAVDAKRFRVRYKLEGPASLTVTPIGVEFTKVVGTIIVNQVPTTRPSNGGR